MPTQYEIRISGLLDDPDPDAFAGLNVTKVGQEARIVGELDQAALHGLLERIRSLGVDLIEARRLRRPLHLPPR